MIIIIVAFWYVSIKLEKEQTSPKNSKRKHKKEVLVVFEMIHEIHSILKYKVMVIFI